MDPNQQVQEEDELTEIVCQEADLKDGQWVCIYWYVYLHRNTFSVKTKVKRNNPLVGDSAQFYCSACALM